MYKKIVSLILVAVMVFALSITAMATPVNGDTPVVHGGSAVIGGEVSNFTTDYTMSIPAGNTKMNLTKGEANLIGNVTVKLNYGETKSFASEKHVYVTIQTKNGRKDDKNMTWGYLKNDQNNDELQYGLKFNPDDETRPFERIGFDKTATEIEQELPTFLFACVTSDSTKVSDGNYTDVLTFVSEVVERN